MIRDFTKSVLSFSWALSLLGMKQTVNLLRPRQPATGGDLFAPMTQVAVDQLDESLRGIYRSGDNLQASAVDLAFSSLNPSNWLNPNVLMRPFTGGRRPGTGCCQGNGATGQNTGNGFTQAVSGVGQLINQVTAGFTQAVNQETTGVAQAATSFSRQTQGAEGASAGGPGGVSGSDDSAGASWGPMPADS